MQYTMCSGLLLFYIASLSLSQIVPCKNGCAACSTTTSACTACPLSYELNTQGECIKSNNDYCSIYSINSVSCEVCQPTFRPQNGTCLKDFSGCIEYTNKKCSKCSFGKRLTNGVCIGIINCAKYNGRICTECQSGYFLNKNICYSTSPNCQRIDYSSGACIKCVLNFTLLGLQCVHRNVTVNNCYIFAQSGCSHCKAGYSLLNGSCMVIPTCQKNYYLSPAYQCIELPDGCKQLDRTNSTCQSCYPNHQLINSTCIPSPPPHCFSTDLQGNCIQCEQKYYAFNYSCKPVSPYCLTYTPQGKCVTCKVSYFIRTDGLCKDPYCLNMTEHQCLQCRQNYKYSPQQRKCKLVDTNCEQITDINCLKCMQGHYLTNDACKPLPDDCLQANRNGACLRCQPNYYLQFEACFPINNPIPNCRVHSQRSSVGVCQICEIGYFVSLGKCFQIPPFCSNVLSNGMCAACAKGYKLASTRCIPSKGAEQYCAVSNNKTCVRCRSSWVLGVNGFCYPTNNTKCFSYDDSNNCMSCNQQYLTSRGICLVVNLIDMNCKRYSSNQCLECYLGYYLAGNQCKAPNFNCSTFNQTNGGCLTCFDGFVLTNQQCVIKAKIASCVSYNGKGQCLYCAKMFYLSNNTCLAVNPLCQNYNPYNGRCTSCFPGYAIKNSSCIKQNAPIWSTITNLTALCKLKKGTLCIECPHRYYLRNNICILVSSSCQTYNGDGNCLTCNVGFFLQNRNCLSYSTLNGTDQNCKLFRQESYCLECYLGFVNIKGSCKSADPLCRTYESSTGYCLTCYQGYRLTNNSCQLEGMQVMDPCTSTSPKGECLQCTFGYYIQGGKCTYNQSIKKNNFNIPFCQSASNQTYCVLCSNGFYPRNGVCYQVSSYCQTYNFQTGDCLTCKQGYLFQINTCVYPAMGIDPKCDQYTGVYCSKCVSGFYLKNYQCTPIDPRCLNFNNSINQCLQCSSGTPYFDICQ